MTAEQTAHDCSFISPKYGLYGFYMIRPFAEALNSWRRQTEGGGSTVYSLKR